MWRAVRTPYGGPVPTPRDSAVVNQLIGLEEWGGNLSLGGGESSAPSPGVSESSLWSGELVFGMGNSLSGVGHQSLVWAIVTAPFGVGRLFVVWAIVVPVWGVSFWCGQL